MTCQLRLVPEVLAIRCSRQASSFHRLGGAELVPLSVSGPAEPWILLTVLLLCDLLYIHRARLSHISNEAILHESSPEPSHHLTSFVTICQRTANSMNKAHHIPSSGFLLHTSSDRVRLYALLLPTVSLIDFCIQPC